MKCFSSCSISVLLRMVLLALVVTMSAAFAPSVSSTTSGRTRFALSNQQFGTKLSAALPGPEIDLATMSLVTSQEVYGFGIVALGESIYSFSKDPNFGNVKVLVPGILTAIIMFAVSGPAVSSASDMSSVGFGLQIASVMSLGMGLSYVARMLSPKTLTPKEVAFLGLLVSLAGFSSFSQNLIINGFITLPELPFDLPALPHVDYGEFADEEGF